MKHYIYFMQCKGFIKIGKSRDVKYRQGELQGGNPFKLECLGTIECECESDERTNGRYCETEPILHEHFKHLKEQNEWYSADEELLNYIQEHAEPVV